MKTAQATQPRAFPPTTADLRFDASDDVLLAHVQASPLLPTKVVTRAKLLHEQSVYWGHGLPLRSIACIWNDTQRRLAIATYRPVPSESPADGQRRRARAQIEQLRAALLAVAIFEHMLSRHDRTGLTALHGNFAETPEAKAFIEACPALSAWKAQHDASSREIDRRQAEESRRAAAEAPAALLQRLRIRGVILRLGDGDTILVPPGTSVRPDELREIRELKDRLVELLRQPPPAALPVILA